MDYVDLLLLRGNGRGTAYTFATARPHEIQIGDLVTRGSGTTLFKVVEISRMVDPETIGLIAKKTSVTEVGTAWRNVDGGAE